MISEIAKCYVLLSQYRSMSLHGAAINVAGEWVYNHGISQEGYSVFPVTDDQVDYYIEPNRQPFSMYTVTKFKGYWRPKEHAYDDGAISTVLDGSVLVVSGNTIESYLRKVLTGQELDDLRWKLPRFSSDGSDEGPEPYDTFPTSPVQLGDFEIKGVRLQGWIVYFWYEGLMYPLPLREANYSMIAGHIATCPISFSEEDIKGRNLEEWRNRVPPQAKI